MTLPTTNGSEKLKNDENIYCEGFKKIFKTTDELESAEEGEIVGTVPEWLRGKYLRIGPGKFDFKDFTVNNFLDGLAILCKFEFESDGKVLYSKRFLRTDAYKKALEAGKPVLPETHTCSSPDPSKSYFRRMLPSLIPEMSDNVMHNLFFIGRLLFASNETNNLWMIDPETLTAVEKHDSNKLFGLNQSTAHPIFHYKSQEMFTWGCSMTTTGGCKYNIMKIPIIHNNGNTGAAAVMEIAKQCETLCSISPWNYKLSSFIHTCGITDNYFILIEQPFFTNLAKVAKSAAFSKSYSCSEWLECPMDQVSNRFYVIDRRTGLNYCANLAIFSDEPFVFSHVINAFEDDKNYNDIVIDVVAYENPSIFKQETLNLNSLRENGLYELKSAGIATRFIIPKIALDEAKLSDFKEDENLLQFNNKVWTKVKAVKATNNKVLLTGQAFTEAGIEMPVINSNYRGRKYKYFYGTSGFFKNNSYQNSVFKINTENPKKVRTFKDSNCIFGEPCFVAKPLSSPEGRVSEDDGAVLVGVNNFKDGSNYLLILDGKKLKQLGKIIFNSHIPPALHGIFVPEDENT